MSDVFYLKPGHLQWDELQYLIKDNRVIIALDESSYHSIDLSRQVIKDAVKSDKIAYGVNTGLGLLANKRISPNELHKLQYNAIVSHACGTGSPLPEQIVRMILLLKINSLSIGCSGVRRELIDRLIYFYNHQLLPLIPAKGSVGASGDLVPLAHMSLPLIGEGAFYMNGQEIPATQLLAEHHLSPLVLEPKEGLALVNGLQVSQALALSGLWACEKLFNSAIHSGCLTIEAVAAKLCPFDDRIHQAKGHKAQIDVAAMYRNILSDSHIDRTKPKNGKPIQDPYSIRCQPQVMGAIKHQMDWVRQTLQVEMNSVSDNPLVFSEDSQIISGGNFHGEMIAMMADNLALAIAEIGALSERRIALLIDEQFSGLPSFLVNSQGTNSGFMMPHVTAAACASENKALAHPHVVDSIPTSANQEDHVSMATAGARRLHDMIDNTATIVAIELLCACQGVDLRGISNIASKSKFVYDQVRSDVPMYVTDRYHAPDIAMVKNMVLEGVF